MMLDLVTTIPKRQLNSEENETRLDCECSCKCSGCQCTSTERPSKVHVLNLHHPRTRRERIRISERVQWQDEALNDFTGNMSGIVGTKKPLHVPVKRKIDSAKTRCMNLRKKRTFRIGMESPTVVVSKDDGMQESHDRSSMFEKIGDENLSIELGLPRLLDTKTKPIREDDEDNLKETLGRPPVVPNIRQELPQRPTAELDLSSEDESSDTPTTFLNSHDKENRDLRQHYDRLHNDDNVRLGRRQFALEQDHGKQRDYNRMWDLWSSRGKTLLGYDFVAGSVDNSRFLRSLHANCDGLKEFRESNRKECMATARDDSLQKRRCNKNSEDLNSCSDHHCLHSYRINDRFFMEAENVDEEGRSLCRICYLLRDKLDDRPTHISVNVPINVARHTKSKNYTDHRRSSFKSKFDSLALLQNCDFKSSRR